MISSSNKDKFIDGLRFLKKAISQQFEHLLTQNRTRAFYIKSV